MDYCFIETGTAGTLTGISRKLKELDSSIKIIACDCIGSGLALPEELNKNPEGKKCLVEGIGIDFLPRVCDRSNVDEWVKMGNEKSFYYARRLIAEEGFLCGGSSGTMMAACMEYIQKNNIGEGKRCVIICADNVRNYISKFINNDWMVENSLMDEKDCAEANVPKLVPHNVWGKEFTIKDLKLKPANFLTT